MSHSSSFSPLAVQPGGFRKPGRFRAQTWRFPKNLDVFGPRRPDHQDRGKARGLRTKRSAVRFPPGPPFGRPLVLPPPGLKLPSAEFAKRASAWQAPTKTSSRKFSRFVLLRPAGAAASGPEASKRRVRQTRLRVAGPNQNLKSQVFEVCAAAARRCYPPREGGARGVDNPKP